MDALDIGCLLASAVVVLYTFFMISVAVRIAHSRIHPKTTKDIAIVCIDIDDSCGKWESDENFDATIVRFFQVCRELFSPYNVHEIKNTGDGFLCMAHSVTEAVGYITHIQIRLSVTLDIQVHASVHCGVAQNHDFVLVWDRHHQRFDIYGRAVNLVCRINGLPFRCHSITLSTSARECAVMEGMDAAEFDSIGPCRLRGMQGTHDLWGYKYATQTNKGSDVSLEGTRTNSVASAST